jgi:DNA end-binding protein Ku
MKAINKTDLLIGNNEIAISIYSAIESETSFKQISKCCNSAVNYKKVCSSCLKELSTEDIKKGLAVGDTIKEVDTEKVKLENTSLKVLGLIEDTEENGVFHNGDVWFIGIQEDKSKDKLNRTLIKYSYLRESLRTAGLFLIGLINVRGKEHIVILKPYFKGFVAIGLYHFDRIRNIQEISNYSLETAIDNNIVKQMSENLKIKEKIAIKNIENTRNKLIEEAVTSNTEVKKEVKTENPLELIAF